MVAKRYVLFTCEVLYRVERILTASTVLIKYCLYLSGCNASARTHILLPCKNTYVWVDLCPKIRKGNKLTESPWIMSPSWRRCISVSGEQTFHTTTLGPYTIALQLPMRVWVDLSFDSTSSAQIASWVLHSTIKTKNLILQLAADLPAVAAMWNSRSRSKNSAATQTRTFCKQKYLCSSGAHWNWNHLQCRPTPYNAFTSGKIQMTFRSRRFNFHFFFC